ncbi:MAG: hypothetical protein KGD65_15670 [Candidatus Lokiarchaeota archaeon]|nr:hypothetical protein [Candidatus Lokiarchaeota archaeon]
MKIEETIQKKPKNELNNILASKLKRISILIIFKNKKAIAKSDPTNK